MTLRRPTPLTMALAVATTLLVLRFVRREQTIECGRRYNVSVSRVYDGDTFETSRGQRVRLLGIDAPEVAHGARSAEFYGRESGAWLTALVLHQTLTVEEGIVAKDRYGRTLAWVYLNDGRLLSEVALRTGNARLLTRFGLPLILEDRLRRAQSQAQKERIGLWSESSEDAE